MLQKALMMKVEFVLEIARKDQRFLQDLNKDPFRTISESGIDLSPGEVMAIMDVVKNTSHSLLAPHLPPQRKRWQAILADAKRR